MFIINVNLMIIVSFVNCKFIYICKKVITHNLKKITHNLKYKNMLIPVLFLKITKTLFLFFKASIHLFFIRSISSLARSKAFSNLRS
jgi:hypothetical protein